MMDGVQEDWFIPGDCAPGTFYNRSMGYIKIEGDMCNGGEEKIFSYKKTKCPDTSEFLSLRIIKGSASTVPPSIMIGESY